MTRRFPYDESQDPPAPMLPVLFAAPGSEDSVLVPSLVDTGADCTLVPAAVARQLRLPLVDRVLVEGVGGATRRAPVYAAEVRFAGRRCVARIIGFDEEAILGRDLLNRMALLLDGPRLALSIT